MPEPVLRDETRTALLTAGLQPAAVERVVRAALDEDLDDRGDITSAATVDREATLRAGYVSRRDGTIAGLPLLLVVFDLLGGGATVEPLVRDGERVRRGQVVATVTAPARLLLTAERTSLNLLGHLSGVATATRSWVDAVAGTGARIRDTRKTLPGLRDLEKYAVRCGGGVNHRRGLYDAYLVKDNHVAAAGGVAAAVKLVLEDRARLDGGSGVDVQIEVDDLDQLAEALPHRPPSILLDNFSLDDLRTAVRLVRTQSPDTLLEASGGLTLADAAAVAATGVDFLAVGALTHSAPQLDIGLDADTSASMIVAPSPSL